MGNQDKISDLEEGKEHLETQSEKKEFNGKNESVKNNPKHEAKKLRNKKKRENKKKNKKKVSLI